MNHDTNSELIDINELPIVGVVACYEFTGKRGDCDVPVEDEAVGLAKCFHVERSD